MLRKKKSQEKSISNASRHHNSGLFISPTQKFIKPSGDKAETEKVKFKIGNILGHDFSNVNIEQNSQESINLNAKAFTKGNTIHFAPSNFNINTDHGKELLGHELTHVKQQREGKVNSSVIQTKKHKINQDTNLEKEADFYGKKAIEKNSSFALTYTFKPNWANDKIIQKKDVDYIDYNDIVEEIYHAINDKKIKTEKVYSALSKLRRNPVAIENLKLLYEKKYKTNLDNILNEKFTGSELSHIENLMAKGETSDKRSVKSIDYTKTTEKINTAISGNSLNKTDLYDSLLSINNNPVVFEKLKKEYLTKYKLDLKMAVISSFKDENTDYVLELLKDKSEKEQVNVNSKEEVEKAKKIIKQIKDNYNIDINSKKGIEAIKKNYAHVSEDVLDQLNTTSWEFKEIEAVKKALDIFAPILGEKRKISTRNETKQEVFSIGKIDQAITSGQLDSSTLGEYFSNANNFSLFTKGTNSTFDFVDNKKQLVGTIAHEIAHGLLKYKLTDFVEAMDYWLKEYKVSPDASNAEKPITDYGKKNASEDFSESVMYYVVEPEILNKKCPKRYKFIKKVIEDWKKNEK